MSFQKKLLIVSGISICIAGLLIVMLLLIDFGGSGESGQDAARDQNTEQQPEAPDQGQPGDALATEAPTEEEATEEEAPEEEDLGEPMLTGLVFGDEGPIAGAQVLLFSVKNVEATIRSFERFDPGAGMPDIPKLIAAIKEELNNFRESGREEHSDEEGIYAFYDIDPASYFVLALGKGHVFRYGDVVSLSRDHTEKLDLKLERGARIAGKVVNVADEGMPGVIVTAEYHPPGMQGVGKIVQKLLAYVNGEFLKGPFQALTNADGSFVLDSLPPAVYDLLAEKEGFPETRLDSVATGTNEAIILLQPGTRIEGLVIDNLGLPVTGLDVKLVPEIQMMALPFPGVSDIVDTVNRLVGDAPRMELTDKNGAIVFNNTAPGRFKLEIKSPGYLPLQRALEIQTGERVHSLGTIRVDSGGTITGWVRAEGGAPVNGATVSVFPEGMTFFTMGGTINDMVSGRTKVSTEANGLFRISGIAAGKYSVYAQARGYGGATTNDVDTDSDPIELELKPGIAIAGRVIEAGTEKKLAGIRVSATGIFTTTDKEGKFLLEGVSTRDERMNPFRNMRGPGGGGRRGPRPEMGEEETEREPQFRVRASASGYQDASETVPLSQTGMEVVIELSLRSQVRGVTKSPEGDPLPGTLVRLIPGDGNNPFMSNGMIFLDASVANLDGEFTLDIPSDRGEYSVLASHPLYASTSSTAFRPLELEEDDLIEVQLSPGGTVRGVVTDGSQPISAARIRLSKAREENQQMQFITNLLGLPKEGKVIYSNDKGEFEYAKMLPGDYVLTAEVVGFGDTKTERFTLVEEETREIAIIMDPGGEIFGEVLDQDELPLSGARVRILKEGGMDDRMFQAQRFLGGSYKSVTSDGDGRFMVPGLPAASYTIIAEKAGYSSATLVGVSPGEEKSARLLLIAAAQLEGRVTDVATGLAIQRYELRIVPIDSTLDQGRPPEFRFRPWRGINDGDGRFFKRELDEGRYLVEVRAATFAEASREVMLRAGELKSISIALDQAGIVSGKVLNAETGKPIEGVRIGITPVIEESSDTDGAGDPRAAMQKYFENVALSPAVYSESDGTFVLDSFPGEPRAIIFSHNDFIQEFRNNITVGLGEEKELTVHLKQGRVISGRVIDATGEPLAGSFLLLQGASENVNKVNKGVSVDGEGNFSIGGLSSGTYNLIVASRRRESQVPHMQTVEVNEEDVEDLVIQTP